MKIVLYTKTGCPWCKGVLDLFKEKNVVFEERDCRANPAYMDELLQKSDQNRTPTLEIDGVIVAKDSDKEAVALILKEKGYAGF